MISFSNPSLRQKSVPQGFSVKIASGPFSRRQSSQRDVEIVPPRREEDSKRHSSIEDSRASSFRRIAAAIPAMPPPTIATRRGLSGRDNGLAGSDLGQHADELRMMAHRAGPEEAEAEPFRGFLRLDVQVV